MLQFNLYLHDELAHHNHKAKERSQKDVIVRRDGPTRDVRRTKNCSKVSRNVEEDESYTDAQHREIRPLFMSYPAFLKTKQRPWRVSEII